MQKLLFLMLFALFGQANAQNAERANPLQGKRMAVIGDSYVRNHKQPVEYTWHYKFAQKHQMEYLNFGRNGSCIAYNRARFGEAICTRYTQMPDSLDYIVVIAGHNDATLLDSIGGINAFRTKLSALCEGLIHRYPTAKIFFFTRWTCENFIGSNSEKVVDAMLDVCGSYGIPVFDCARNSGIYATEPAFRQRYFQGPNDTAHLNAAGHDRFLPRAENFILQY